MYFPYLRGKQFELIALRELLDLHVINKSKISPIIEPVKKSSSFEIALRELKKHDLNFNIIVNPENGNLTKNSKLIIETLEQNLNEYDNFQVGIIIQNKKIQYDNLFSLIQESTLCARNLMFIYLEEVEETVRLDALAETYSLKIRYNVVDLRNTGRRYYKNFDSKTVVSLDDYFDAKNRNKDYLEKPLSFYTDEHLYYQESGFVGFSDFLTIGDSYSETGALPYAIAIHISFIDQSNKIRVMHFVSDSNEDQSDIARKFAEAVSKLVQWANTENIQTKAINDFRELHENGHFPGLGSLKKLSIENHIEVVLSVL